MKFVEKNWPALIYAALLFTAVLLVYGPGLQNEYIFDDARIADGTFLRAQGSFFEFRLRWLSTGSFNWIHTLTGKNMPAQRVVNVLLHLGTCWALYKFFALLFPHVAYSETTRAEPGFAASQLAALRVGVLVYAMHPIAAYAVGYLIQRSIVMATLFGVLACWAFVRGVTEKKWPWYVVALVFYAMGIFSKQQVAFIAGLAFPLYIFLERPDRARVIVILAVAGTLLGVALVALPYLDTSELIGRLVDEPSRAFAAQLDSQRPGALAQIYPLSILNEAALFFYYGALWVLPYVGWMSIDMHPPFPLTLTTIPHVVGAMAYLALLIAAVVAVVRRSDVWGFVGLCLLFPLILFWTEFSTVWVQDPFVLYRSYLWAIPIPALVAILLTGFSPGTLYKMAVIVALALGVSTVDRVSSMRNAQAVWADAMEKVTVPGAPNAVGRARAFMNHGMERLKRFEFDLAMRDFSVAHKLGAIKGEALFAMGMTRRAMGNPAEALQLLQQAESAGYADGRLHFQRAQAFAAMGSAAAAIQSYTTSLALPSAENYEEPARADRADLAMRLSKFEDAKTDFEWLLVRSPKQTRYLMGLGLAQLGLKDAATALQTFNLLMLEKPDALAHYGRALAQHQLGNKVAAQDDIGKAVQMEPSSMVYKKVQESIKKGEKLSL
jgi:Flp pilus assembly protein TadD